MKLSLPFAALLCALLLAGCAAGQGTAVPAAAPSPTAAPTATPEPTPSPTPDPASLLEYTVLPLDAAKSAPDTSWWWAFTPYQDAAKEYARQFAMGLYNNDPEAVRAACAGSVLTAAFPLEDLTGLNVTEFNLSGGQYDAPTLMLTVTDPGTTPLLRGRHYYTISYDGDGKVNWLSLYNPGPDFGGNLQYAVYSASLGENRRCIVTASADPADPLGLTGRQPELTYCESYWNGTTTEYLNQQDLGAVDATPYGITMYTIPPEENCLTEAELITVCDALNQQFAALADGSYQSEWYDTPGNDAQLSAWDAAVPLPVSITPDVLRSEVEEEPNAFHMLYVYVPLPQNCWAVYSATTESLAEGTTTLRDLVGPVFYQTLPAAAAAVMP